MDIRWAAGYFDAKASITRKQNSNGKWGLYIYMTDSNRSGLESMQSLFAGSIETHNQGRAGRLTLFGKQAEAALEQLLPFLILKRARAADALLARDHPEMIPVLTRGEI